MFKQFQQTWNIASFSAILLLIGLLALQNKCSGPKFQTPLMETLVEIDTFEVVTSDTVWMTEWKTLPAATIIEYVVDDQRHEKDSLRILSLEKELEKDKQIIGELTGLVNASNDIFPDENLGNSNPPKLDPGQRAWQGGQQDDNVKINYEAITTGTLDWIQLSYELKNPTVITNTIEKVKQIPTYMIPSLYRRGLYIGAQYNHGFKWTGADHMSVSILADYTTNTGWRMGYQYRPYKNMHSVGAGFKILDFSVAKTPFDILKPTETGYLNRIYLGVQFNQEFETAQQTISVSLDMTINSGFKLGYQYTPYGNIHSINLAKRLIPFKNK